MTTHDIDTLLDQFRIKIVDPINPTVITYEYSHRKSKNNVSWSKVNGRWINPRTDRSRYEEDAQEEEME